MAKVENLSEKIKIVIGRLLKDADVIVKKVLTVFDPSKDSAVNITKMSKLNRTELDAAAEYLEVPLVNTESKKKIYSTRRKLAKRIVLEITSLYPSVCGDCDKEYTVMPGNQPKYRCWICLQGAHDCEDFTAKMEVFINQPGQPSGMVWLCYDSIAVNSCIEEGEEPPSGIGTPIPTLESNQSRSDINLTTSSSSTSLPNERPLEVDLNTELSDKLRAAEEDQRKSESKPNICNHVCPRLCEGTCPHGISGKKAADGKDKCELFHPKRCWKYMRHYTHETKGCKDGDNCAYLHVNLCQSSLKTKKCKDVNCKLMHLMGTKRPKSMLKKKDGKKKALVSEKTSNPPRENAGKLNHDKRGGKAAPNPKKSKQKDSRDEKSFLGMKSLLDEMKTSVLGEIKCLRTEMDLQKQQIEMLMKSRIQSVQDQQAGQYGHYKLTPYGTQQCQHQCQKRTERCSEIYPPSMTPIRPACC